MPPMSLAEALAAQSTKPSFRGKTLKPKVDPSNPVWRKPPQGDRGDFTQASPSGAAKDFLSYSKKPAKRAPPAGARNNQGAKGIDKGFVLEVSDKYKGIVSVYDVLAFEKSIQGMSEKGRRASRRNYRREMESLAESHKVHRRETPNLSELGGVPFGELKRSQICRLDHVCRYCMGRLAITEDHVIPRSRGGSSEKSNLVGCCKECNFKKGDMTPKEAGMVLHVPLRWYMYSKEDVEVDYLPLPPHTLERQKLKQYW